MSIFQKKKKKKKKNMQCIPHICATEDSFISIKINKIVKRFFFFFFFFMIENDENMIQQFCEYRQMYD
jgi:hypothetical protein